MAASLSPPPGRVILLGRRGFVAESLIQHLAALGWPTLALGRPDLDLTAPDAAARLAARLQPNDHLICLAALTPEHGRDGTTFRANLAMIENVGAALTTENCAHFTYVSSDAVYGWESPLIHEAMPPSPTDLYGLMHLTRETLLRERLSRIGQPYAVLRPAAIYGTGDPHQGYGPNRFATSLRRDGTVELIGQGEEQRDHVALADIVAILIHLTATRQTGILNGITGNSVSFLNVAKTLQKLNGGSGEIIFRPRRQAITHRFFDATRLHRIFPGHTPTSLARGLQSLVEATDPQ